MAHTEKYHTQVEENLIAQKCHERGGIWDWANSTCYPAIRKTITYNERDVKGTDVKDNNGVRLTYTGLAPDAPIVENGDGGKQSKVEGRFDLIPPIAMFELAKVMQHGAEKYVARNWYKIPLDSHINHLLMHTMAYLAGDRQEDHLSHVLARAAMAVEIQRLRGDLEVE